MTLHSIYQMDQILWYWLVLQQVLPSHREVWKLHQKKHRGWPYRCLEEENLERNERRLSAEHIRQDYALILWFLISWFRNGKGKASVTKIKGGRGEIQNLNLVLKKIHFSQSSCDGGLAGQLLLPVSWSLHLNHGLLLPDGQGHHLQKDKTSVIKKTANI